MMEPILNAINDTCCYCDKDLSSSSSSSKQEGQDLEATADIVIATSISKYKCPACERLYCSANCCVGHKDKFDCSGIRNPIPFVQLAQFDQKHFLDDFFFLEGVNSKLETLQRNIGNKLKTYTRVPGPNQNANNRKRKAKKFWKSKGSKVGAKPGPDRPAPTKPGPQQQQ